MKQTRFAVDFLEGREFEGYTRGENWNGFACPYFTFDQAKRIVDAWPETGGTASYVSGGDEFIFQMSDGARDSFGPVEIEGMKLYPIGNGSWIWDEQES